MLQTINILLLILCISAPAIAQEVTRAINGSFEYTALELDKKSPYYLRGNVINKTDRNWEWATFQIFLYDKTGNPIRDSLTWENIFTVRDLKRGERRPIGPTYGKGKRLLFYQRGKPARVQIHFISGLFNAEYDVALTAPAGSDGLRFEDDSISVDWIFGKEALSLSLTNKTDTPLKVDWGQASYVDVNGTAEKVVHLRAMDTNHGDTQSRTIIAPGANIQDSLLPASRADFNIEEDGRWNSKPMFPDGEEALTYKGKSFWVFIPMEVNGKPQTYLFIFKISDVKY
jgi:hypothetical protein